MDLGYPPLLLPCSPLLLHCSPFLLHCSPLLLHCSSLLISCSPLYHPVSPLPHSCPAHDFFFSTVRMNQHNLPRVLAGNTPKIYHRERYLQKRKKNNNNMLNDTFKMKINLRKRRVCRGSRHSGEPWRVPSHPSLPPSPHPMRGPEATQECRVSGARNEN